MNALKSVLIVLILLLSACNCGSSSQEESSAKNQGDASVDSGQIDHDEDGYTEEAGDCDDLDNDVHPDAFETCNGQDDNCNGEVDEGNPDSGDSCNTGNPGICAEGATDCRDGLVVCIQITSLNPIEICNGADDNCNGEVDEGNPDSGDLCSTGQPGICDEGFTDCQNGALVCTPNAQLTDEICNELDDDCDGQIDEDFETVTCGLGECKVMQDTCVNGKPQSCTPKPKSQEQCNNKDDNCNGQVDENSSDSGKACPTKKPGICAEGTTACLTGKLVCIQTMQPGFEICNGKDDNCNGQVDEWNPGGGEFCKTVKQGVCASGKVVCQNSILTCVSNLQPTNEACNGLDDNCNGQTDEGNPGGGGSCQTGKQGVCASGKWVCQNSALTCAQNTQPASELCNNLDDNCDGQTDEDNPEGGQPCSTGKSGICAEGTINCQNGTPICIQNQQPGNELCNNQDDDCDGQTDEENAAGCSILYYDGDNDGYGIFKAKCLCAPSGNYQAAQSNDCDDANAQVHPNAPEVCDNVADNNCDGFQDPNEIDNDNDGVTECQNDCDDASRYVKPGLFELCDLIDNNCNNAADEDCNVPLSIESLPVPSNGALRGVFSGGSVGDSGRNHLGVVDNATGLFHYLYKFYWSLDSGEGVKNGAPSIANTAQAIWNSGRLPLLDIRVDAFSNQFPYHYLTPAHVDRLRQFAYWMRDEYSGEIAIAVLHEMNLEQSPYCNPNWSKTQCVSAFKDAFVFISNLLIRAAPNKVHVGLNYNMRFYGSGGNGVGEKYTDWSVNRVYYDWVGYNIFVHACKFGGNRETNDIWFLKGALKEPNNNFHDQFCANAPCIIAETAASNSCSAGYQNWWIDRFSIGNNPGFPYFNLYFPWIKGYVWFHQDNKPLGGWEENWLIANYGYYASVFGNPYYVNKP